MAIALVTGVTLLWCAPPLRADETSKSAKAEELLQLTQGDQMMKMMEPMMKGMLAQMDKDMPAEQRAKAGEMQGKMMALVAVSLSKAKPALAKVYADTYGRGDRRHFGVLQVASRKSPSSENAGGDATLDARDDADDGRPATANQNNDGRNEGKVQVTDYLEKGLRIRNRLERNDDLGAQWPRCGAGRESHSTR